MNSCHYLYIRCLVALLFTYQNMLLSRQKTSKNSSSRQLRKKSIEYFDILNNALIVKFILTKDDIPPQMNTDPGPGNVCVAISNYQM